jgi:hypothetical protein
MSKITELLHTGVGDLLIKVNNRFDWLAEKTGWNTTVFYVVAIAVAVVIGLWAMRLIKPISALAIGGVGYLAGTEIYRLLVSNIGFMEKWPDWGKYVLGGVLAVILAILGWKKCLHAVLVIYAVAGYYFANNVLVGIAGALLLTLLAAFVVRFAFILVTSAGSAYLLVLALGKLLPKVSFLQLAGAERTVPLCVFGTVAIVLFLIQCETTRSYELG